ncbi:MAG TPA: tol-pal system-associated acyl-CoA thioesterase [Betaproteobacteria bacterium]|nr:tol-pal system-associated acyl-CoA thioesterase [Betaproteobacteria bacterium]HAT52879.1 tol-pal system-associated acyl-CoA thioesterase [Betaproteobacteria bacterium]
MQGVVIIFAVKTRIYYQDTDAGGVVYHARYLDFFERARADWLRHLSFESSRLVRDFGVILVVRKLALNYHHPARLDDEVDVSVDAVDVGRAQVTIAQSVRRAGLMLADASVNLALIHACKFMPVRFPLALKEALQHYV